MFTNSKLTGLRETIKSFSKKFYHSWIQSEEPERNSFIQESTSFYSSNNVIWIYNSPKRKTFLTTFSIENSDFMNRTLHSAKSYISYLYI